MGEEGGQIENDLRLRHNVRWCVDGMGKNAWRFLPGVFVPIEMA
jgi:hypothetical protein